MVKKNLNTERRSQTTKTIAIATEAIKLLLLFSMTFVSYNATQKVGGGNGLSNALMHSQYV